VLCRDIAQAAHPGCYAGAPRANVDIGKPVAVKIFAAELITSRVVREHFMPRRKRQSVCTRFVFSGADTAGAVMSRAVMSRAVMSRAIMSRAIMSRAIMSRAYTLFFARGCRAEPETVRRARCVAGFDRPF
jgi:pentapeptide repeat protein